MDGILIYTITILIVVPLLLNTIATFIVLNTYFIVKNRRLYQLLFIWLVPYIGASMAIYTNREDYFEQKRERQIGNGAAISNSEAVTQYIAGNHLGGR